MGEECMQKCEEDMQKEAKYQEFLPELKTLISGESDEVSVLANISAAIKETFGFFWVGFYLVKSEQYMHLGPFQGSTACYKIPFGRGVCGSSWKEQTTHVVPDVEEFPGHIACSSLSRSEIVVPIFSSDRRVVGVLDIDSTELATFDDIDRRYLEQVCQLITETLYTVG